MNWYSFIKAVLKYPFRFLYRVKIEGRENEPEGPYIICGNHSSLTDPILVTISIKARPVWIGKKELLKHAFMRWVFRVAGAIPINREGFDTSAIRQCVAAVKSGACLGIFPQGTRIRRVNPEPGQAHAGLALIAGMVKATVLPVSIVTKRRQPGIFRKTKIIIHKPIPYEEYSNISEHPTKQEMTNYIFSKVCAPFNK